MLALFHLGAAVNRRWTRTTRALEIVFLLLTGLQLGWHSAYGHLFVSDTADNGARIAFQLIGGVMVIAAALEIFREWSRVRPPAEALNDIDVHVPSRNLQTHTARE